jgi:pullulanase-type alpha-1,6-glucosidase
MKPSTKILPALTLLSLLLSLFAVRLPALAQDVEQPGFVGLPGTHQSELACPGDWQPECETTSLLYDPEDGVWQAVFTIQPGNDQDGRGGRYKVALDKSWSANYGLNAQNNGADIPLVVDQPTEVKFYYDHASHWVADSYNNVIATVIGDFQQALGCTNNDDPGCLRSWLQDADGDGVYAFSTSALPAGTYAARVAINESLDEVYGAGSALGGEAISFTVPADNQEMYFGYTAATHTLLVSSEGPPRGDLRKAQAHWVLADTIAWKVAEPKNGETFALYYSPSGGLELAPGAISGGESIPLSFADTSQDEAVSLKYPHLSGYAALKLDAADLGKVPEMLKGQLAVVAFNAAGKVIDATALQIPGVLDDLYFYNGPLGVQFDGATPTLRLWAPTARSVTLQLFPDPTSPASQTLPMTLDEETGVWSRPGEASWLGQYYLYEIEVYVPQEGALLKSTVTDPYSVGLSMNSLRSQIVDLNEEMLKPEGWETLAKPPLAAPEDSVIYELHIRDFSASDESVPTDLRGTYLAFTQGGSDGMRHLASLAQAGLTHIHLLPAFDIASIEEDKSKWQTVDPAVLAGFAKDSEEAANALRPFRDQDGFNWGYDPFHYNTPEGSYAAIPDGSARTLEFRQMVQALNQTGLRVVMDVVYNHTNASGQSARSVLDKVVPGYYHRLNGDGQIERSTCCENTATENLMMEKLMIDSVVLWAKEYKVDGFRFDLMGHHMVGNMVKVRAALDALTMEKDGVDGSKIIVYGEGWDFGEVASNARGLNATQLNLGGSGIATFNDRLRDAARGGGPFNPVQEQGFITGLLNDPNDFDQGRPTVQKGKLLKYMDWISLGLAGNLKDFVLIGSRGNQVTGAQVDYNGKPAGYTEDPQEQVVYVSAHDNETLFDAIQYKAPLSVTPQERARINNLGVSLVMLSQGIPFYHAGDDLLRSKSLDGNSYNSGDWYNRLDFTYQSNNWAVGLPDFRADQYALMRTLFGEPNLTVGPDEILFAHEHFLEMLQIRRSSPLFRMQTGELVLQRLSFLGTPETRLPGVIAMALDDTIGGDLDPDFEKVVVVFNAMPDAAEFSEASLMGLPLKLHPVQAQSVDDVILAASFDSASGAFFVPGRSAAVFVLEQSTPEPSVTPQPTETQSATEVVIGKDDIVIVVETAQPTVPAATVEVEAPEPAQATPWLPYGIGAIVVAVGAGLVYWWSRRRK